MSCAPFAAMMSSPCSPPIRDQAFFPWNWHEVAETVDLKSPRAGSAAGAGGRPASPDTSTTPHSTDGQRRGRPRLDAITSLIREGSSSPSSIKCKVCNRVFPREKSLQAHMRTHTGEKPYLCDFPGCSRAFAQSGQLKTHQRLHTGEKPFICSEPGCNQRYTHSNRRCSRHPLVALRRDDATTAVTKVGEDGSEVNSENQSEAVALWLKNHLKQQQQSPSGESDIPKARQLKRELDAQARIDCEELLQKKKKQPASTHQDIIGALALIELHQGAPSSPPMKRVKAMPSCAVYPTESDDRPLDLRMSRYCTYDS